MLSAASAVALLLGAASQIQAAQAQSCGCPKKTVASQAAPFVNAVKSTILHPNIHWSIDTSALTNIVPIHPLQGSELYYGVSDPLESGHFAFLTYYFKLPSVNIDHTDHVTVQYDAQVGITASFDNKEAFKHALDTWSAQDGLVLIAHVPGCGGYAQGERCYFSVSDLEFREQDLSVIARGSSKHPDEIATSGETEWGWWDGPKEGGAAAPALATSSAHGSVLGSPSVNGSSTGSGNVNKAKDKATGRLDCLAPPDTKYGLPTACWGNNFDHVLDKNLGYDKLSVESAQYLDELMSSTSSSKLFPIESTLSHTASRRRRRSLVRRGFGSRFRASVNKAVHSVVDATHQLQSIGVSRQGEFTFKVPDFDSSNEAAKQLMGRLGYGDSPWGQAILLGTFSSSKGVGRAAVPGSVKVYCVDCSVSGHARVAGRAKWSPEHGLQEGHIEMTTTASFGLKVGLDGNAGITQDFSVDLFNLGLPALSFGIVEVGPYISVGARISISAGEEGHVLAGATMGVQDARIVMDLVDRTRNDQSGWTPYFRPVFEAPTAGLSDATVELGLPFGLKCGIKISTWEEAVGLVDEPSIKATANIAGLSTVTTGNMTTANMTTANMTTGTNGTSLSGSGQDCVGLRTQISWRNRLWAGLIGSGADPVLDSTDHPLFQRCVGKTVPHAPAPGAEEQIPPAAHAIDTKFVQLVNAQQSTRVVSCANGNVYAVRNDNSSSTYCFGLWEATQRSEVVHDGVHRPMHYYSNTMSALGVSRLRVSNAGEVPRAAVAVALVPMRSLQGQALHVALDPSQDVFYPVVCDYVDKSTSKVFLVRDAVQGLETLQSRDVAYSVTGGDVAGCKLLAIKAEAERAPLSP
ncbi:hypothetical protein E4U41_006106 [Claviceps citrina]|nr:hypothetical protein E4U41_006106 [Claviceps citrina]